MLEMAKLKVPIICIVIGEGSSGGALALCVGDRIIMLENAVYSILSPEGFASILYKDSSKCKEAAENMKLTANDLMDFRVIDTIIKEPNGGVTDNSKKVFKNLKQDIVKELDILTKQNTNELIENRYNKFRKIGK